MGATFIPQPPKQPSGDTFGPPKPTNPYAPQQMPFDPAYESAVGANNTQYDVTSAGLQYQAGRIEQTYGFTDTSNPFNRAAMLERNYHQSQSGNLNSMAGQGQLYSGALQRQQDEGTFTYNRNRDSLQREYQDARQANAASLAQAGAARGTANADAFGTRVDRALANPPADPGKTGPGGTFPHKNPKNGQMYRIEVFNGVRGHRYQDGHFVPAKRK